MTKKSKITAVDFESSKQNENFHDVTQRIKKFRKMINDNDIQDFLFWKMYRDEFKNCSNDYFESINKTKLNLFRFFFKKQNVWISTNIKISIVNALLNVLKKENRSKWTAKKIIECYQKKNCIKWFTFIRHLIKQQQSRKRKFWIKNFSTSKLKKISSNQHIIIFTVINIKARTKTFICFTVIETSTVKTSIIKATAKATTTTKWKTASTDRTTSVIIIWCNFIFCFINIFKTICFENIRKSRSRFI